MIDYFKFMDGTSFYENEDTWVATSWVDPYTIEVWEKFDLYKEENRKRLAKASQMKIKGLAIEKPIVPKIKMQTRFQYFNKNPKR